MIPLIVLVPLAVSSGGLIGLAHERFGRKRQAEQSSIKPLTEDASKAGAMKKGRVLEHDTPATPAPGSDIVQIKRAERAAYTALGVSAAGIFLPPLGLVSLPIVGYSAYSWLRTRYPFEKPWLESPSAIFAGLAMVGSLATGIWVLAPLILSVDLAARKKLAKLTNGYHVINEPGGDTEKWYAMMKPSNFIQRRKNLIRMVLQGEPRWGKFPALLARVSMGLFFAISGWFKLFTAAHWSGLVAAMIATGLPYPKFLSYFLASVEFYGGSLLTIGFMSTFWSIALAFAMLVALVTFEIGHIIPAGLGPFAWLDWLLYLPQVLYIIIFIWLIVIGPGPYSVDAIIARKLGVDKDSSEDADKSSSEDSVEESRKKTEKEDKEKSGKGFGFDFGSPAPVGSG